MGILSNLFSKKEKGILVLAKRSFNADHAKKIQESTGKMVILADDVNDVRAIDTNKKTLGDGKAVFLGEGSIEEHEEFVKEEKGLKGIFGIGR